MKAKTIAGKPHLQRPEFKVDEKSPEPSPRKRVIIDQMPSDSLTLSGAKGQKMVPPNESLAPANHQRVYDFVNSFDFRIATKEQALEPATGRALRDLLSEQKEKSLPLVLARCQCPLHEKGSTAKMSSSEAHEFYFDGTLAFAALSGDEYTLGSLEKLDKFRRKDLHDFVGRLFSFYLVDPFTEIGYLYADKSEMTQAYENEAVSKMNSLQVNSLTLDSVDNLEDGLYVAGIFYAGLQVKENKTMAKEFFTKTRENKPLYHEADALMMCVSDKIYSLLKALVGLGLAPSQPDEDGLTAKTHARQLKDFRA